MCTLYVQVIKLLQQKYICVDEVFLNPLTCKRKAGLHVSEIG